MKHTMQTYISQKPSENAVLTTPGWGFKTPIILTNLFSMCPIQFCALVVKIDSIIRQLNYEHPSLTRTIHAQNRRRDLNVE